MSAKYERKKTARALRCVIDRIRRGHQAAYYGALLAKTDDEAAANESVMAWYSGGHELVTGLLRAVESGNL